MHTQLTRIKTTCALLAVVWMLAGCIAQATPPVFELSGRMGLEGTAHFPQPVLVDGQGKKWILECTNGAANALQGRRVVVIVRAEGSAPASTLGVSRVCVRSITPQ